MAGLNRAKPSGTGAGSQGTSGRGRTRRGAGAEGAHAGGGARWRADSRRRGKPCPAAAMEAIAGHGLTRAAAGGRGPAAAGVGEADEGAAHRQSHAARAAARCPCRASRGGGTERGGGTAQAGPAAALEPGDRRAHAAPLGKGRRQGVCTGDAPGERAAGAQLTGDNAEPPRASPREATIREGMPEGGAGAERRGRSTQRRAGTATEAGRRVADCEQADAGTAAERQPRDGGGVDGGPAARRGLSGRRLRKRDREPAAETPGHRRGGCQAVTIRAVIAQRRGSAGPIRVCGWGHRRRADVRILCADGVI